MDLIEIVENIVCWIYYLHACDDVFITKGNPAIEEEKKSLNVHDGVIM